MGRTLYGLGFVPFFRRAAYALYEMGIEDFEHVEVNSLNGGTHTEEYLAKNPFGKIPYLDDNGYGLFESRAVARYVAEKYAASGPDLLGSTVEERGLVSQWLDVEATQYFTPVSTIVVEKMVKPTFNLGPTDDAKVAEAKEKLSKLLDVYDAHLAKQPYLAGDKFTLADLTHIPFTEYLPFAGEEALIASRPHVKAWWERIKERSAVKKVQERFPVAPPSAETKN